MPWNCQNCRSEVDEQLAICWQCGTGVNGEPPAPNWQPDWADGSERVLTCLRCASPMKHAGLRHLQDGTYAKEVLLGEFFLERIALDMYRCEGCSKVEFFATRGT